MRRIYLFLAALLALSGTASGQSLVLQGTVVDTAGGQSLHQASVVLIRASDSVLNTFTRTAPDGSFTLRPSAPGRYLLLITHPAFADYSDALAVPSSGPAQQIGRIPMLSRLHLLQEVVIKRKIAAIALRGDTTEYAADSFVVREGASVEELLKKLPGLRVDRDGKITAQGQTVQKVLVDGEEFFSDDPAVVTQNLQARTVDKVQVYDKKSDAAEFTGIDDGTKTKVLNLLLKEDAKKGYFGKLVAGGGTDGYFDNQGMVNLFRGKRKLSVFAIGSNTGRAGLNWTDVDRYGGGHNYETEEESGFSYIRSEEDEDDPAAWNDRYNGQGLPQIWTGGVHYSNKWADDKQHLSGNYRVAHRLNENVSNDFTQYILPDSQYFSRQQSASFTEARRHGASGLWEWKPDSAASAKATLRGGATTGISNSSTATETRAGDGALVNSNDRQLSNAADKTSLASTFDFRKRLKKKGRTLSLFTKQNLWQDNGLSFLKAVNTFYTDTGAFATTIDQQRQTGLRSLALDGKLAYTEPLSKTLFLELHYGLNYNQAHTTRLTYNRDSVGEGYHQRVDPLSADYDFNVLTHRGGTALRLVSKKLTASAGASVTQAQFFQTDRLRDTSLTRSFTNFFPQAHLRYAFTKQRMVNVNYNGATRQPGIEQIQPLRDNTDPLNIAVGNPGLRQSFTHNVDANFNDYKIISGSWTYANVHYGFVQDDISRAESVDELGRRVYQYVNVDGNQSGWLYAGFGGKIPKTDLRLSLNGSANIDRRTNIVNGILNENRNNKYGAGFGLDWDKEKKFDLGLSVNATYSDNHATISTLAASYWSGNARLEGDVTLPWKLELGTEVEYLARQQTAVFDRATNVLRWDAYLSRKFLKGNALEARAAVYDILNQNLGFSRVGDASRITENNYLTIRRYALLSLVWHLSSQPINEDDDDD